MRVAVMSDVHGFDLALQTVLDDLDRRGPWDEVVVAGDLCVGGPAPRRVLELLWARDCTVLRGNGDRELVAAAGGNGGAAATAFALSQIGSPGVAFLAALPFARRITPSGGASPGDDLLVVHANPHDLETKLHPDLSDEGLRKVIGETRAAVIAFGHHHVAFIRDLGDILLVNVSAVGNPRDGQLRCAYGIVSWHPEGRVWTAQIVRLDYPVKETLTEMRRSGMPDPESAIRKLLRASYEDSLNCQRQTRRSRDAS